MLLHKAICMKGVEMLKIRFDSEKALEAILYVASKAPVPDIYHVGKILYYADRAHLERYGRLITGDEYKAMIEQNGGKNVGSISGKTSFILAGENMGPSKLQKAEKLGVQIIDEDTFLSMLE